jgi:hypothetical protein
MTGQLEPAHRKLHRQLLAAERRRDAAAQRIRQATAAHAREKQIISQLKADLRDHSTHAMQDWPDPDDAPYLQCPVCRRCGCARGSISAGRPCPGDRHSCPVDVPPGTPGSFKGDCGSNGVSGLTR